MSVKLGLYPMRPEHSENSGTPRRAFLQKISAGVLGAVAMGPSLRAAGDGLSDDTAYLQAALDQLFAAGGGRLALPPGTYRVSIGALGRALRIYPNIIIQGAGRELTRIKLLENQRTYYSLMAPDSFSLDCSGFQLLDLTIYQNATNNPPLSLAGFQVVGGDYR